jgi:hypothetical protein
VKFRPEDDPHPNSPVEWADNWLSNAMAFVSIKLLPGWCQSEDHWTSRTTQFMFTDCPCCLFYRGLVIGLMLVTPFWLAVIALVWWWRGV